MHINVLGTLTVAHAGRRCALPSSKTGSVLGLLALDPGNVVPIERLIDDIWPDRQMANSRNALHANVRRLRKVIDEFPDQRGDEVLRTVHGGYMLALPQDAVDACRFLRMTTRGAALVADRPAEAVDVLESALEIWRGPALAGLRDSLRLRLEATNLDERRLSAHEDLATAQLALGRGRALTATLRSLAGEHPERERLVELLMLALYDDGRPAEALDAFRSARRRLVDELGLEPGPALHRTYQAILTHDVAGARAYSVAS